MDVAISTLTPLRFLQRSEDVWADRPAVRDGDRLWTYSSHGERVRRAAGGLRDALGIADGDRVATLCKVAHTPDESGYIVCHWFRFEGDRIAELWDLAQEIPRQSPNTLGPF